MSTRFVEALVGLPFDVIQAFRSLYVAENSSKTGTTSEQVTARRITRNWHEHEVHNRCPRCNTVTYFSSLRESNAIDAVDAAARRIGGWEGRSPEQHRADLRTPAMFVCWLRVLDAGQS